MSELDQILANEERAKKENEIIGYIATGSYDDHEYISVGPAYAGKDLRDWNYIQSYYFPNDPERRVGPVSGVFEPFPVGIGHTKEEAETNLRQYINNIEHKEFNTEHTEALQINEIYNRLQVLYDCVLSGSGIQNQVRRIRELLKELGL